MADRLGPAALVSVVANAIKLFTDVIATAATTYTAAIVNTALTYTSAATATSRTGADDGLRDNRSGSQTNGGMWGNSDNRIAGARQSSGDGNSAGDTSGTMVMLVGCAVLQSAWRVRRR